MSTDQMLIVQEEVHLELQLLIMQKRYLSINVRAYGDPNNNDLDVSSPVIDIHNEVL